MSENPNGVTAIVTAFERIDQTLTTIGIILATDPPPDEVIVHVDGNSGDCATAVSAAFPQLRVLVSVERKGPGGARNRMLAAASHEYVASFDDDSYPMDKDYFARVKHLFSLFPEASVLTASVYHRGDSTEDSVRSGAWASDFCGGACAYRRSVFLATDGYVPLPFAYGMEEVDLALRLHASGARILQTRWLRVFHDTDLARHASPDVTAASIANVALLGYLRYPPRLWFMSLLQCCNRISWLLRNGRWRGTMQGVSRIPFYLKANRRYRATLATADIRSYLRLRRCPRFVSWHDDGSECCSTVCRGDVSHTDVPS